MFYTKKFLSGEFLSDNQGRRRRRRKNETRHRGVRWDHEESHSRHRVSGVPPVMLGTRHCSLPVESGEPQGCWR